MTEKSRSYSGTIVSALIIKRINHPDNIHETFLMAITVEKDAEKVIEGYPLTRENYELALGDLYDTYGDKEVVINHHVSKLLSLLGMAVLNR